MARRGLAAVAFLAAGLLMASCVAAVWSPVTSPGTYDFGTLDAGAGATNTVTFTLSNTDRRATASMDAVLQGSTAFEIVSDGCSGRSLPPRKTCQVRVQYAPTAVGEDDSATLAATGPQVDSTILLSGRSGTPHLAWSPSTYDFGTVDAGSTPTQEFTLTNSGDGTSNTLTAALVGADDMTLSDDTCTSGTLAPNGTCGVTVEYAPTGASNDSATLSAGGADATITGTGQAAAPLEITGVLIDDDPAQPLSFTGETFIDGSADHTLVTHLANVPAAGVTYQWIFSIPGNADYQVDPDQTDSTVLVKADSLPALTKGLDVVATLTVTPKDGGSPVTVKLKLSYQLSALTLGMSTICEAQGPGVTVQPSAASLPLDGALTITQTVVSGLNANCTVGVPFEGTVTISSDGQALQTIAGGPDVGDGTSPAPTGPFVIDGSTLGLGDHTITLNYAIWNGPAWAPFTKTVPITVTATSP